MVKSFKQIYEEDKDTPELEQNSSEGHISTKLLTVPSNIELDKVVGPITEVDNIVVGPITDVENKTPVIKPETIRVELTEEIANVLTEQREQSAKVLESVMKTNTKIANSITKLMKGITTTNTKLIEAILALTDKIEILEVKLEAIENLEIPTPIVNLQMPSTKIIKEVHRDKKTGMITHITESEAPNNEDE